MNSAVILAAGESSRMENSPKANLLYRNKTFLENLVVVFQDAGIDPIIVVLGAHVDEVKKNHVNLPVEFIVNTNYQEGQLSSIKESLKLISAESELMIVHLVDHPLIQSNTIMSILFKRTETNASVIIPTYENRRGHPVLFGKEVFSELQNASIHVGAREVVWNHKDDLKEVATNDRGILININSPEEYRKWCENEL